MLRAFRHVVHAAGYSLAGFYHLFRSELAARLEIGAGVLAFAWLIILFAFTLSDYVSRGWMGVAGK